MDKEEYSLTFNGWLFAEQLKRQFPKVKELLKNVNCMKEAGNKLNEELTPKVHKRWKKKK